MQHDLDILMDIWHKRKIYNFEPYNVLLSIATKYSCAAYDCFHAAGSHIIHNNAVLESQPLIELFYATI